jgi:hypothetical protein
MKQLHTAVPGAIADLLRQAPLSPGKVDFAWKAAVGPTLQRATHVRLEGDVLLVDTTSVQWGREVMRSSPVILRRLREFLGAGTVTAIHVRPPASELKPERRRRSQPPAAGTIERRTRIVNPEP